jgi:hypothetical protein
MQSWLLALQDLEFRLLLSRLLLLLPLPLGAVRIPERTKSERNARRDLVRP